MVEKSLSMQPKFVLDVPADAAADADQAVAKLRAAIESPQLAAHAESAGRCVDFRIEPQNQRFWSPHLSIQLSDTESGSQIVGRFSPRPEIWTMFMAVYGVVASGIFAAAIYAYCQWFMEQSPWALWLIPIGLLIIGSLHLASLVGQSLSRDQMELLRRRFDLAMQIAFERES